MTRFRVTASTVIDSPSLAHAKDWWSEKIALEECPCTVEISATEITSIPSIGPNHPAALAFHYVHNAAQVAVGLELELDGDNTQPDARRIVELLNDASMQVAALYELFQRQERVIEIQRTENIELARAQNTPAAPGTFIRPRGASPLIQVTK